MRNKKVWLVAVTKEEVFEVYDTPEAANTAREEIIDQHDEEPHDVQIYERSVRGE